MVCGQQAVKEGRDWRQAEDSGGSFLPCEAYLGQPLSNLRRNPTGVKRPSEGVV